MPEPKELPKCLIVKWNDDDPESTWLECAEEVDKADLIEINEIAQVGIYKLVQVEKITAKIAIVTQVSE